MELIIWMLISEAAKAALSGVIGNKADKAVDLAVGKSLQAFTNRRQQGDESIYSELQKATRRSFLLAQQSLASECLKELTSGRMAFEYVVLPGYEADVRWLEQKLKQLKADLKAVEKAESVQSPVASLEEIESLLTPDGALAVNSIQTVREKLIALVKQEGGVSCYQAKAEAAQAGIFERMCAYFAFEIKNNPVVCNIVQMQLLTQINANLKTQQLTVQDLENSLRDFAQDVPQVLHQLNNLEMVIQQVSKDMGKGFEEVRSLLTSSTTEILETVTTSAVDIEAIKTLLKQLIAEQQRNTVQVSFNIFNQQGWNVKNLEQKD
jgi:vacuolar-type H+-ATPase subunit I/STV1